MGLKGLAVVCPAVCTDLIVCVLLSLIFFPTLPLVGYFQVGPWSSSISSGLRRDIFVQDDENDLMGQEATKAWKFGISAFREKVKFQVV